MKRNFSNERESRNLAIKNGGEEKSEERLNVSDITIPTPFIASTFGLQWCTLIPVNG